MKIQKKTYYLVKGRLDLSTLDSGQEIHKIECNVEEKSVKMPLKIKDIHFAYNSGNKVDQDIRVYTDQNINEVLKEMGEYFSGIN